MHKNKSAAAASIASHNDLLQTGEPADTIATDKPLSQPEAVRRLIEKATGQFEDGAAPIMALDSTKGSSQARARKARALLTKYSS